MHLHTFRNSNTKLIPYLPVHGGVHKIQGSLAGVVHTPTINPIIPLLFGEIVTGLPVAILKLLYYVTNFKSTQKACCLVE